MNGREGRQQLTATILQPHGADLGQDVDDGTAAVEEGVDLVLNGKGGRFMGKIHGKSQKVNDVSIWLVYG